MNGEESDQVVWTTAILRILIVLWACEWVASLPWRLRSWGELGVSAAGARIGMSLAQIAMDALVVLATAALVFVVWRVSLPASRLIWRSLPKAGKLPHVFLADLQIIAYTTLGLYVIISAIPVLSEVLVVINRYARQSSTQLMAPSDFTQKIAVVVVQIVAGLFLFFNAAAIARRAGESGRANQTAEEVGPDA
ncbi:MAG TPA: hypothetical protein VKA63_12155 [Candidatus Krumholzibacteria bacterium]|nr:hypothetical protein [Candidatus Krumholzibacteria bacterium]